MRPIASARTVSMASFLPAAGENHQIDTRLGNLQVADIHVAVPKGDQPQADRNRRGME
jgi:hypothetical protein